MLAQTIDIMMDQTVKKYIEFTDFELIPDVDEFGTAEFIKGPEIFQIGMDLIEERLDELEKTMNSAQQQFAQVAQRINSGRTQLQSLLARVRQGKA